MTDYLALAERLLIHRNNEVLSEYWSETMRDAAAALREAHAERESFYADYRMKCDEQTKALHVEVERLRALLLEIRRLSFDDVRARIDAELKP
jgi:hypothetical protein